MTDGNSYYFPKAMTAPMTVKQSDFPLKVPANALIGEPQIRSPTQNTMIPNYFD